MSQVKFARKLHQHLISKCCAFSVLKRSLQMGRMLLVGSLTIALLFWASRLPEPSCIWPPGCFPVGSMMFHQRYLSNLNNQIYLWQICSQVFFCSPYLPKCPVRNWNWEYHCAMIWFLKCQSVKGPPSGLKVSASSLWWKRGRCCWKRAAKINLMDLALARWDSAWSRTTNCNDDESLWNSTWISCQMASPNLITFLTLRLVTSSHLPPGPWSGALSTRSF